MVNGLGAVDGWWRTFGAQVCFIVRHCLSDASLPSSSSSSLLCDLVDKGGCILNLLGQLVGSELMRFIKDRGLGRKCRRGTTGMTTIFCCRTSNVSCCL